ncbi:hypothetical protein OU798_02025 [Prolixibacteraceae bacterium Z1-6]|uniref:Uncharacterized protein n=1 Tax=Draconibacterium aestuarii TaxID=2998507 RepID=A0A9X3F3B9_9BACT|nr:hypothetical protein [Prolixibacteraceae bacterium Z1-6]
MPDSKIQPTNNPVRVGYQRSHRMNREVAGNLQAGRCPKDKGDQNKIKQNHASNKIKVMAKNPSADGDKAIPKN